MFENKPHHGDWHLLFISLIKRSFRSFNMAKQIIILLGIVSEILGAKDYAITKYKFVGYRNVWHNGQDHTVSIAFVNKYYFLIIESIFSH